MKKYGVRGTDNYFFVRRLRGQRTPLTADVTDGQTDITKVFKAFYCSLNYIIKLSLGLLVLQIKAQLKCDYN